MFDMIESALAIRATTEPSSPLVVSVPHAGLLTAGFERTLNPELDVRCDPHVYNLGHEAAPANGPER